MGMDVMAVKKLCPGLEERPKLSLLADRKLVWMVRDKPGTIKEQARNHHETSQEPSREKPGTIREQARNHQGTNLP